MKLDISRRFSFIESRLYWAEGLTAGALAEAFGVSRQSAQAVIEKYRQLHPGNMQYDEKKKQHVVTEAFTPHYIRAEANLFFAAIRGQNEVCHYAEDVSWSDVPFEDVSRCIKTKINYLPAIMSGLIKKHTVEIYYVSKNRITTRYISPHHLVYADGRYHLRAYCHMDNEFLDFVISRIRSASCGSVDDWVSATDDHEWHQYVTLVFKVNPELPETVKQAVEEDYILNHGLFSIRCRRALALYVRRQMMKYDGKSQLGIWLECD
jgi:predicted DNA-binding transcriptional regulator YafY